MPTTRRTLDPDKPPKLTDEQKAAYDAKGDDDIDYSDAPELDETFWANVELPPRKKAKDTVSVRLDAATVEFFKNADPDGRGHTRRMADVLTAYARAKSDEPKAKR